MDGDTQIIRHRLKVSGGRMVAGEFGVAVIRGRVAAIGAFSEISSRFPGVEVSEYLAVAHPPANPHTHLDLTRYPLMAGPFSGFMEKMARMARAQPGLRSPDAARAGAELLAKNGVETIGDIVARKSVMESHLRSDLAGIAFWEILAPRKDRPAEFIRAQRVLFEDWRRRARRKQRIGLSPHSPYLVGKEVLRAIADWSQQESIPLQIHVSESPAELEFFRTGAGPLSQSLRTLGRMQPTPESLGFKPDRSLTPIKYLAEIGFLRARPTLVHAVNATGEDLRIISQFGCSVIVCPRSNMNLQCGRFPWDKYRKAGIPLTIGTDSMASSGKLDPAAELQTAIRGEGGRIDLTQSLHDTLCNSYKVLGIEPPEVAVGNNARELKMIRGQMPADRAQ